MTKMAKRQSTMNQLLVAARKRWTNAGIEHNPEAPSGEERAVYAEQNRIDSVKANALRDVFTQESDLSVLRKLSKAAEFVCDVNGDHPSIEQLRGALEIVRTREQKREECSDLKRAIRERPTHVYRWSVYQDESIGGFAMRRVHLQADTAEELLEKIQAGK